MIFKLKTGKTGEEKAVAFLKRNGYRIVERNFRNRLGEIDIVAKDKDVVCFVEVRTRRGPEKHGQALESIGRLKRQRLSKLALSYLRGAGGEEQRARFDVISVSLWDPAQEVILLKDAFPLDGS